MKIDGVSFIPASRKMLNQDILDLIRQHSAETFDGDLDRAISYINWMMDQTELKQRFWMAEDERPLDLMVSASRNAMAQAGCAPEDIDLLIYTSNCRGFIEPGDSYFVAQALGMDAVDCFDIVDACMAWSRACDIVQSHFLTGRYKRALLVNAESYFTPGGVAYPSHFQLRDLRHIAYSFGAYCGGDGATATVLSASPDSPWEFHFSSTKTGVDLCTIPLPDHAGRSQYSERIGLNGIGAFTSFGSLVFGYSDYLANILKPLQPYRESIKFIFPHTGGSIPAYKSMAQLAGFDNQIQYIYPQYGNIGAASVPAGIALYAQSGVLQRGDRLGFWVGSAGMSFVSCTFIY